MMRFKFKFKFNKLKVYILKRQASKQPTKKYTKWKKLNRKKSTKFAKKIIGDKSTIIME